MRTNKKTNDLIKNPNHAIKCIRKAMGFNQGELGKLLGLTQSYVANMETGRYPTPRSFAIKLAGKSGADVNSIINKNKTPLDAEGYIYTEVSYRAFKEARKEKLNQDDYSQSLLLIDEALRAAADIGKIKIFTNIINASLQETILAVDGLKQTIENKREEAIRLAEEKNKMRIYTYGELRSNTVLAQAFGFIDDPSCDSQDIALKFKIEN
jgi:transcriptional regulator with XRE-family HTH domain